MAEDESTVEQDEARADEAPHDSKADSTVEGESQPSPLEKEAELVATKNAPSTSIDNEIDLDEKVMKLRSRIIGVMLKNKHRQDAAGLARAAKQKSLGKYLSEDLTNIGVYQPERRASLEHELGRHYEEYILPIVSNNLDTTIRPPSIHEKPKRNSFLSWLFGTCAMASGS